MYAPSKADFRPGPHCKGRPSPDCPLTVSGAGAPTPLPVTQECPLPNCASLKERPCGSEAHQQPAQAQEQKPAPAPAPEIPSLDPFSCVHRVSVVGENRRAGNPGLCNQPALGLRPHTLGAVGRGPATDPSCSRQKQVQKQTSFHSGAQLGSPLGP